MNCRPCQSHLVSAAVATLLVTGCFSASRNKVVFGTVTCDGQLVETGRVRFVPAEGTKGPASQGTIVNGHYRIDGRGGIPIGRHRVEIVAERKTGRKIPNVAMVGSMIDELERVSADEYAGEQSPLIKEITRESDGRLDLEVPPRS